MSRIINRLVEESGGWEKFLYRTLKDVIAGGIYDEAMEILEVYEETGRVEDQAREHVKVPDVDVKRPVKNNTHYDTAPAEKEVEPAQVDKPKATPRKMRTVVRIDKEVGASNGELPIPQGNILTNRNRLEVTTADGTLHLGRSEIDGQIRGKGVRGHISLAGTYRLVFTETKLGTALIQYEVIPGPAPKPAPKSEPMPAVTSNPNVQRPLGVLPHPEAQDTMAKLDNMLPGGDGI
jgi:hypothetical protein